ncbi:MAG: ABC transporter permease [Synergistaceae bacterium]|jgi:osmoprotectant transport system permease protein|nr:ABC transporter permease [Synergistaceae bacterium]
MFIYILNNWTKYEALVTRHVSLTLAALAICFCLGVMLGALCFRNQIASGVVTSVAGALRVVPSLAVMLILMPVLGVGVTPALTALVIIGLPPVIINTASALGSADKNIIEAAEACAMSERRIFWKIRVPLAMPFIITGLRLAGLSASAGAILAAYIGAGGLGELILSGLSQYRMDILLAGAVTTMAISLFIECVFQALYAISMRNRGCAAEPK